MRRPGFRDPEVSIHVVAGGPGQPRTKIELKSFDRSRYDIHAQLYDLAVVPVDTLSNFDGAAQPVVAVSNSNPQFQGPIDGFGPGQFGSIRGLALAIEVERREHGKCP